MKMHKVYIFMVLSTVLYAINGTVDYVVVKNISLGTAILSIALGLLAGVVAAKFVFGLRMRTHRSEYAFGAFSALMITGYTVLLFMAYTRYTLASIYPLIGLSALVFFLLDALKYRRSLRARQTATLLFGVLLVVVGTFYAESNGYSFQIGTLPFAFGIAAMAGVGYYTQFYRIDKYSIGTKMLFQPLMLIPASLLFLKPIYVAGPYFFLGLLGGFTFAFASVLELRAMKMTKTKGIARALIKRNFINDFEYSDILLVLIMSVIIGSFYPIELLGGVIIAAGIVIIGRLQR